MRKRKPVEPIPEEFGSYEEAARFWDTHDTQDYPDALRRVNVDAHLKKRHYEVEIDVAVARQLKKKAKREGVTVSQLVSELLRRQLAAGR